MEAREFQGNQERKGVSTQRNPVLKRERREGAREGGRESLFPVIFSEIAILSLN